MKRSFPPPAREALCALALVGVLNLSAGCEPNQDVEPGPPELMELTIVHGGTPTTVTTDTPLCPAAAGTGVACLPMGDMSAPPDSLCRFDTAMHWCTCVPDAMDDTGMMGSWDCEPFANVTAVIAVFDRLLDTAPLDPGDLPGRDDIVTFTANVTTMPEAALVTDYSSTGDPNGLLFNLFGPFFGNFRGDGPSLLSVPDPGFPSGATITVTLDAAHVQAKDGVTPFVGEGQLQGGTLVFATAPFTAAVVAPEDPAVDATVTIAFTNFADLGSCPTDPDPNNMDETDIVPCQVAAHVSVTAAGAPAGFAVASADGATYTVTPTTMNHKWPAGAVVVSVDATTENVLGQVIDMAQSVTFTAP